jgi:preprotein translocase subunit SecG
LDILVGVLKTIYFFGCAMLVITVLMQSGKGGGIAAAFGGGGGVDSAFGAQVGGPLRKATAIFGMAVLVLAIALAVIRSTQTGSVVTKQQPEPPAKEQPAEEPAGEGSPAEKPEQDEGAMAPASRLHTA